ncbi:hypothetical protein, partial [Enterococcus casseliflavus]|uniref:hypothetical protein n=1 Tax=Enterococcus casseliflavus TaxID=37734 RepID=UPI0039A4DF7C
PLLVNGGSRSLQLAQQAEVTPERLQGFFASAKILQRLHSKRCTPFLFFIITKVNYFAKFFLSN